MKTKPCSFASENYAPVHPAIMNSLSRANYTYERSYGSDRYSASAIEKIREHFGEKTELRFTFNGTGANVLALSTLVRSFGAVICSDEAHVFTAESTALEALTGCRLVTVQTYNGKIIPEALANLLDAPRNFQSFLPQVLTITQPTELGTVYTVVELTALITIAREYGLYVHMDGARLFNAAVFLDIPVRSFTADIGVDVLTLGGTKNGLMFGEAVLFFSTEFYVDSIYLLKRSTQLASKMRYIACQFEAVLTDNLANELASHSNAMAVRLAQGLCHIGEVKISRPVETNAVFVRVPPDYNEALLSRVSCYVWSKQLNELRLMSSFDTTIKEVNRCIGVFEDIFL